MLLQKSRAFVPSNPLHPKLLSTGEVSTLNKPL
jgi:hypothetical protein